MDIEPQVTHRCCPSCGYLVDQIEFAYMRDNLTCPKCNKHTHAEFQPLNINTEKRGN